MILVTVLLLTVFLLMVGGFFLSIVRTDFTFQKKQDANEQAYFLALSGIEFYRNQPIDLTVPNPFDIPPFGQASPGVHSIDSRRRFEVYGIDASDPGFVLNYGAGMAQTVGTLVGTTIVSKGQFFDPNGFLIAERTLIVPQGLMTNAYEK